MFNWSMDWSKRTHKGIRTFILVILQNSPKTGAEIMDAMEGMSRGWWRPSPGSVYPMLKTMVEEGLIREIDDRKYEITSKGKDEIGWRGDLRSAGPTSVEEVVEQMSSYVSYLEDLARTQGEKLSANSEKLREIRDRLGKLGAD